MLNTNERLALISASINMIEEAHKIIDKALCGTKKKEEFDTIFKECLTLNDIHSFYGFFEHIQSEETI